MEEKQIRSITELGLKNLEYDDCFITEIQVNGSRVEIYLDSDENISFLKCRKVSREVEAVIDERGWWGGKYTLEVSSAGVGRPLVSRRQYPKNIGRDMVVKTEAGEKIKGTLAAVSDDGITLSYEVTEKQGKKKIKKLVDHPINWDAINEAKIKVRF